MLEVTVIDVPPVTVIAPAAAAWPLAFVELVAVSVTEPAQQRAVVPPTTIVPDVCPFG